MSKLNGGGGIRVLVAAASAFRRGGLEEIVQSEPDLHLAGSTGALVRLALVAQNANADVVLIDSDSLPEALASSTAAIVLLTSTAGARDISRFLKVGVRAILARESDADDIVAAIHTAYGGQVLLSAEAAEGLAAIFGDQQEEAAMLEEISVREAEVLRLLAEGLANKDVARRLGISEHTVKFHISSILEKLGAATRTEAVTLGIRRGLIPI
jgi:two-component system, NarL family, response regulator YdfI